MGETPVGKRQFHAFLSHAHVDQDRADELVRWLHDIAGVPVWYDQTHLPPGATIAQALPRAIEDSRSLIVLLSVSLAVPLAIWSAWRKGPVDATASRFLDVLFAFPGGVAGAFAMLARGVRSVAGGRG